MSLLPVPGQYLSIQDVPVATSGSVWQTSEEPGDTKKQPEDTQQPAIRESSQNHAV